MLNTTDKILRLKVSMIGLPIVKIRPGIFTDPEGGGVDPRYFVVLRSLTLLGNEARPCSPLWLLLAVQETQAVCATYLISNFFED